ncbi:PQQ-binding-like beta-propeller repeat protein [Streptomyces sp. NPDC057445]|uniref:outer membrane protein assembly factor BamB family protein n=1 Tax=Streptomyces sp. NPDC057445 TaxID=3346136 RepID=UPI0036919776
MEPLQQDDPRRIGPYTTLSRFRETASTVQYVAHGGPDDACVVVSLARPALASLPAFRRRFEAEARTADRLAGGWVQPPAGAATFGPELWTACAYVPALTLAEAIALAGPLPERAVRTLGAGLAETLSRVHATGAVLHGLTPETVLLAADGPRLTAFGALGAAAHAEAGAGGRLSVRLAYLTPEQLAGERPGAPSDIFVLGLLLVYAATGTTPALAESAPVAADGPELRGVPEELRELVAACLAPSPADRPTAGTAAATLALEGASALARQGWLPETLLAALTAQGAAVSEARRNGAPVRRADARVTPSGTSDAPPPGNEPATGATPAAPDASAAPATPPAPPGPPGPHVPSAPAGVPAGALPGAGSAVPGVVVHRGSAVLVPSAPGGPATPPAEAGTGRRTLAPGVPGMRTTADRVTAALGIRRVRTDGPTDRPQAAMADTPTGPDTRATPTTTATATATATKSELTASVLAARAGAERRALIVGGVAGAAGLLMGGVIGAVVAGGDTEQEAVTEAPAKAPTPVPGIPPTPLWAYEHTSDSPVEPAVWRDRVLVLGDAQRTTGVDLRTGRRLWTQPGAGAAHRPVVAGDSVFVIGAANFLWLSPQDGTVRHRVAAPAHITALTAADGPVVWFSGTAGAGTYLFAYDTVARRELWRTQVPNGRARNVLPEYQGVAVRPDGILVRQDGDSLTPQQRKAGKGLALFTLYDRATGKRLWGKYFGGVLQDATVSGDTAGKLYAAVGDGLHAFDTRGGRRVWQTAATAAPGATGRNAFGEGLVHDGTLYLGTAHHQLYALDTATGKARWSRSTEAGGGGRPRVLLSPSGRTALALESTQVTAFRTTDGSRLWKFQDAGGSTPAKPGGHRGVVAGGTAVVWRDKTLYALPVGR